MTSAGDYQKATDYIKTSGIIAIVRGDFSVSELKHIAVAVYDGGIRVLEITLNSPWALQGIEALRTHMKDQLLLGAGTVRDRGDVERAIGAGAQFLVSPNFDEKSIQESAGRGMLHIPGVFTPTESQVAFRSGCRLQKLYPANFLGPPYLKAIKAPLDDIDFIPTGGISERNIGEYIHAGAAAVAVGSTLINGRDYTYASLKTKAEHLIERLNIARTESK